MAVTNSPCPRTSPRECSTARTSIASLYFTLSIGGREGRKSFSGVNLNGRGVVGVLGVIGTEEHIPCDVRLPVWTPIHTRFSPLKAVWLQNQLAFDITAARLVTDTFPPIAPGDVNAKLVGLRNLRPHFPDSDSCAEEA
jgi:hypothetical protein